MTSQGANSASGRRGLRCACFLFVLLIATLSALMLIPRFSETDVQQLDRSRPHHLLQQLDLRSVAASLIFKKGNLTAAEEHQVSAHVNDDGALTLTMPPMPKGKFSEGYLYSFKLTPVRPFRKCLAYLNIEASTPAPVSMKDVMITYDDKWKSLDSSRVGNKSPQYCLALGRVDAPRNASVRLLCQNASLPRTKPLQFTIGRMSVEYVDVDAKTNEFLSNLDIRKYERQGSDYASPRFSLERLGIPLRKLDNVYDYDFKRLRILENQLKGIDRRRVLTFIFEELTRGLKTNTQRHLAVLRFLHKSSYHHRIQPMYPSRQMVTDPLVLLELAEMKCGQVNRLGIDLFATAGIEGRLMTLGHHTAAEVFYDNKWHYFDGDIFSNGQAPLKADGTVPSIVEMSRDPYQIDALCHYFEQMVTTGVDTRYPSWFFFSKEVYKKQGKGFKYWKKQATPDREFNTWYG